MLLKKDSTSNLNLYTKTTASREAVVFCVFIYLSPVFHTLNCFQQNMFLTPNATYLYATMNLDGRPNLILRGFTMRKKLFLLTTVATSLIIATVAMASGNFTAIVEFEDATHFEDETQNAELFIEENIFVSDEASLPEISSEDVISEFCEHVSAKALDLAEQTQLKSKFIDVITTYNMTLDEAAYIKNLTDGYDMAKVLDIYEFLQWTNSDVSILEEIYLEGIANSDNKNWIYDAYDRLLDRTDDMLSVEDVAYYVASGISVEEIAGAYDLSFAGVKSTKEMLDERISGLDWNTIAAEVISKTPQTILDAPEMTINDIMKLRNYSVRIKQDVSDIIAIEDDAVKLKDTAISKMNDMRKTKQSLAEEYDVVPISQKSNERAVEYEEAAPIMIEQEEYLFEEDYIPVEEPEVE